MSRILDTVHEAARDLRRAGLLDEITMREFDVLCLPKIKPYKPRDIKRIRSRNKVSQAVFAAYLNVGKTTIQQWEQGLKRPGGAALRLLNVVDRKGLSALV